MCPFCYIFDQNDNKTHIRTWLSREIHVCLQNKVSEKAILVNDVGRIHLISRYLGHIKGCKDIGNLPLKDMLNSDWRIPYWDTPEIVTIEFNANYTNRINIKSQKAYIIYKIFGLLPYVIVHGWSLGWL